MKALTILASTLGATVIGVALGLLFAPNKGSNTRNNFDDFIKNVSQSFKNIEIKTAQLAKQGKAQAKKVASDLNSKTH